MGAEESVVSDAVSRSRRRDRALVTTFLTGASLQVSIVLASLLSLPFVTRALSADEFGVLSLLTSLTTILSLADLGVGAALALRLGMLRDLDTDEAGATVTTALVFAACTGGALAMAGVVSVAFVPWSAWLGAESVGESAVDAGVLTMAVCAGLYVVAGLGSRILFGLQRGSVANLVTLVAGLLGSAASILAAYAGAPLAVFVACSLGAPAVVWAMATAWLLVGPRPLVRPHFGRTGRVRVRTLAGQSSAFFVIAATGLVAYQSGPFFAASALGAAAAGVLSVATRLFALVSQFFYPILMQFTPAVAEARAHGDDAWARTRLYRMAGLTGVLATLASGVLVVGGGPLVATVLSAALEPHESLLWALAAWTVFGVATGPWFFYLDAVGLVWSHATMSAVMMFVSLPTAFVLTRAWGISGPVWANLFATATCCALPAFWLVRTHHRGKSAGAVP